MLAYPNQPLGADWRGGAPLRGLAEVVRRAEHPVSDLFCIVFRSGVFFSLYLCSIVRMLQIFALTETKAVLQTLGVGRTCRFSSFLANKWDFWHPFHDGHAGNPCPFRV